MSATKFVPTILLALAVWAAGCGDNSPSHESVQRDLSGSWCAALFCDLPQYVDGCTEAHVAVECGGPDCLGEWTGADVDDCLLALADWAAECGPSRAQPPVECLGLFDGWGR